MDWFYLFLAGILEIGWAISVKYCDGFTKFGPSAALIFFAAVSFYFLSLAMKTLPAGTAYVVFTAIGAVGAVIYGILFLGESKDIFRLVSIALVIIGTVGIKLASKL